MQATIHQFEDKYLSHFSYAIVHNGKMVLIDPSRNPEPYHEFAKQHSAKIMAVIETHLHADFVSSHVEIARATGAKIYFHPAAQPGFEYQPFEDSSASLHIDGISLKAISTPGHSPDSICVLLADEKGKAHALFTGDTLFIGDVGRPDLRETTFTQDATREKLARQLYHSLHDKLLKLPDSVLIYPAHGAGSLCGKNMSPQTSSTIGAERISNYALQSMSEDAFMEMLLTDQPHAPKYFPHSVAANRKKDLPSFSEALGAVSRFVNDESKLTTIDCRSNAAFREGHLKGSINIPGDKKFETWVGTMFAPDEAFCLAGDDGNVFSELLERIVKIGYESSFKGWLSLKDKNLVKSGSLNVSEFASHRNQYTIVDVLNPAEVKEGKIFEESIHIPLQQLRERLNEIPSNRQIVTHCKGGSRGAMAASILESRNFRVYDLGAATKEFITAKAER